jgi:hypothetical protein
MLMDACHPLCQARRMGFVVLLVAIWMEVRAIPLLAKLVTQVALVRVSMAAIHAVDSRQILMY